MSDMNDEVTFIELVGKIGVLRASQMLSKLQEHEMRRLLEEEKEHNAVISTNRIAQANLSMYMRSK